MHDSNGLHHVLRNCCHVWHLANFFVRAIDTGNLIHHTHACCLRAKCQWSYSSEIAGLSLSCGVTHGKLFWLWSKCINAVENPQSSTRTSQSNECLSSDVVPVFGQLSAVTLAISVAVIEGWHYYSLARVAELFLWTWSRSQSPVNENGSPPSGRVTSRAPLSTVLRQSR